MWRGPWGRKTTCTISRTGTRVHHVPDNKWPGLRIHRQVRIRWLAHFCNAWAPSLKKISVAFWSPIWAASYRYGDMAGLTNKTGHCLCALAQDPTNSVITSTESRVRGPRSLSAIRIYRLNIGKIRLICHIAFPASHWPGLPVHLVA